MKPRVLLVSSVHPSRDPRIFYKIAPALMPHYEVFCILPDARQTTASRIREVSVPFHLKLWKRLLLSHPLIAFHFFRIRPAIVHIFVPDLLPLAFLFRCFGSKVVHEVQENLYKKFSIKKYNHSLVFRFFFKLFDRLARKYFYLVFTESAYLLEYDHLRHPFALVRNFAKMPFIEENFNYKSGQPDLELLYMGTISLERSLDTMISAFSRFKKIYPGFVVHFFGPLRLSESELHGIAGYDTVRENLIFHGYLDQQIVLQQLSRPLAGIALLKPVADYPDSYTTKLFEYMAMSIPVITSDFPLYKAIVEQSDCGFCISPYDADALCEKLIFLAGNFEKAAVMGSNGKDFAAENHNWKSEEHALLNFYKHFSQPDR